jgi:hypothetical protein
MELIWTLDDVYKLSHIDVSRLHSLYSIYIDALPPIGNVEADMSDRYKVGEDGKSSALGKLLISGADLGFIGLRDGLVYLATRDRHEAHYQIQMLKSVLGGKEVELATMVFFSAYQRSFATAA